MGNRLALVQYGISVLDFVPKSRITERKHMQGKHNKGEMYFTKNVRKAKFAAHIFVPLVAAKKKSNFIT